MKMSYAKEFDENVTEKDGPMVISAKARIQLLKADAEIARLESNYLAVAKDRKEMRQGLRERILEVRQLKAEVERLREALQVIADASTFRPPNAIMDEATWFSNLAIDLIGEASDALHRISSAQPPEPSDD